MEPVAVRGSFWARALVSVALSLFLSVGQALAQNQQESQAQRQQVQPYNNAPTWREVRSGKEAITTVRGRETGVLVQTYGQTWRQLHNGPITIYGGWLVVLIVAAVAVFYLVRGPVTLREKPTGRLIERFTVVERWTHWTAAITFCILGITGLTTMFGKFIVLPVIGYTLFSWLMQLFKFLHNFVGPLFFVSAAVLVVIFIRHNWPKAYDIRWLMKFGGMVSGEHLPCGRFNAGEKSWFWIGVVILTIVVSVTGLILDFPNFDQTRLLMIQANVVHSVAALLYMVISLGHIYLGTVGVEGAYQGMRTGYVDEAWEKEHHEYWYNDVRSGKNRAGGAAGAAGAAEVPQVQH